MLTRPAGHIVNFERWESDLSSFNGDSFCRSKGGQSYPLCGSESSDPALAWISSPNLGSLTTFTSHHTHDQHPPLERSSPLFPTLSIPVIITDSTTFESVKVWPSQKVFVQYVDEMHRMASGLSATILARFPAGCRSLSRRNFALLSSAVTKTPQPRILPPLYPAPLLYHHLSPPSLPLSATFLLRRTFINRSHTSTAIQNTTCRTRT